MGDRVEEDVDIERKTASSSSSYGEVLALDSACNLSLED